MKRFIALFISLTLSIMYAMCLAEGETTLTFDSEGYSVSVGKTINLKVIISPKANMKLEWISSNEEVATVSAKGAVKGISVGEVDITVKAVDNAVISATCHVKVVQPIKKIKTTDAKLILAPNVTWKPAITIEPEDASIQTLSWTSSNDKIATVDEEGIIHALSVGKCNIIGLAMDDSKQKVTITLQVKEHDYLILDPAEIDVDFETRSVSGMPKHNTPYVIDENGNKVVVTDEMFEDAHHIETEDGRIVVSIPDKEENYRYFEKDPLTGRIFESYVRKLGFIANGKEVKQDTEDIIVTYKNGFVCEGTAEHKIRPLKSGSEEIDIVTKLNGKKVTDKQHYTVFISQKAAPYEGDKEIGRLEAESYEGHTYQVFYSNRTWEDAKAFCEAHGGHLVTITSQKEQKFLERYLGKAEKQESYWIGMNRDGKDIFVTWITREGISFTKWADGSPHRNEPDACVMIAASEYVNQDNRTIKRGCWNDESETYYYINGFICEWDEDNSSKVLPVQ